MRVLYVVGSCLSKNTSANMSHNAYVQGILENGCDVEILMAEDSWGDYDNGLPIWAQAKYCLFPSQSRVDRLRKKMSAPSRVDRKEREISDRDKQVKKSRVFVKQKIRKFLKTTFYRFFSSDPLYPLEKTWLKRAASFRSDVIFDLVVSNSSPAASHKLVKTLLEKKHLKCKRWIQIWEDPWYADLYSAKQSKIYDEEHALLLVADEVYYVSPLTLKYQKELFSDCAAKMRHIPLPYLDFSKSDHLSENEWSFGYFGDYYSATRNLLPFYEALSETEYIGYIYGDSDLSLRSTERVQVNGRVTLDILDKVQSKTRVLVHLCNLRGGQIPGKIYHYSATNKPILFILDGTEEEQKILYEYFAQFDRFYFCKNDRNSILDTINKICNENRKWGALLDFAPQNVIKRVL